MRTPALVLGFLLACVAAITGCGDNAGRPVGTAKELTSFSFTAAKNPGLTADAPATISGDAITAMVPAGTDVTKLVASFETTGASVAVGDKPQTSGSTANNFSNDVTYVVSAQDGTTHSYKVSVSLQSSGAHAITGFSFLMANNAALPADVTATINGTAIAATVPFGTDVTALVAAFTTTGTGVTVGTAAQTTGTTANNFTTPVDYKVAAADGTSATYTVTVTVAASNAKALTAFSFTQAANPALPADVPATITGTTITATVPFGIDPNGLIATFTSTGPSVKVGTTPQVSATTPNNFTTPVTYLVTAADSSTATYTVTVTVALNPAKELTAFSFLTTANPGLPANVIADISGQAITATVPFGTDVTALKATFVTTGASVQVGANTQTSGTTPNNFTAPVVYTVTAANGTTKDFTVTVAIAANPAKDITAYSFLSANNAGNLLADVTADISGTAITATVPFGTNISALIATFTITGTGVKVGALAQTSGITPNDFSSPVVYTVTGADGNTRDFTVTVTVAANTAKDITAYAFLSVNNPGLPTNITATITGTAITATLPFGTSVTALKATFTTSGASVKVGATPQTSGSTPNDFSNPVDYTVTAGDGSTKTYTVTVTVALNPAKDITAFSFTAALNPSLVADLPGTITGTAIAVAAPFGTDVTGLIATFTTTGANVKVGMIVQFSGVTSNDFSNPVTYLVTAADGLTKQYTVTVTVGPAPGLTSYAFLIAANAGLAFDSPATITGTAIAVEVPAGTPVTALVATFATTAGATVSVGGTAQVSGTTAHDFTNPVTYHVTGPDGGRQDFTLTVTVGQPKELTAFSFRVATNAGVLVDTIGTISGTSIKLEATPGIAVTALKATFTTTGASVSVGSTAQTSAVTPNDFTNPVTYTVTASDGSTRNYTVTLVPLVTSFSFTGSAGNNPTFPSDGSNAGLTGIPTMGRQGGTASPAGNVFSGSGWNTATIDLNHYYTFTVSPAAAHTMTLTNLVLKDQRSGSGPVSFSVRSSADSFATDLAAFTSHTAIGPDVVPLTGFANLTAPVEFRFYAFGMAMPTGTWRVDDVQLSGTITP